MELLIALRSFFLPLLGMALCMGVMIFFVRRHRRAVLYFFPVVMAAGAMGIMVWMMSQRVGYAYELEWIEGGVFQQVVRILEGHAPYAKPDFDYVPALYAPLYYYISAGFTFVFGKGLPALRAVSVLASFLTGVAIALSVLQITKSRFAAFLGFLAYSTMYLFTLCWFDVARVDNLWTMCLAFTVMFLLRSYFKSGNNFNPSNTALLMAAIFFTLAIFSKQTSLFMAPFLFFAILSWSGVRAAIIFSSIVAMLTAGIAVLLQWYSEGWFYYFVIEMAPHHGLKLGMWSQFFWADTIGNVLVIFIFSLFFIKLVSVDVRVRVGWLVLLAGFAGMSLLSRMYAGGEGNVLMPYFMLLTIMSSSYFVLMVEKYRQSHYLLMGGLSVLLAFNFYHGWVSQAAEYRVPNRRPGGDDAIGDALVRKIAQVPGRVCITMHGYLAYLAGKDFCSHRLLLQDVLMSGNDSLVASLQSDARSKIMSGYYQAIIIDDYVEIQGLGIKMQDIPYTMTLLENDANYPQYEFYPIVSGTKPRFWLEYNGVGFINNSAVLSSPSSQN